MVCAALTYTIGRTILKGFAYNPAETNTLPQWCYEQTRSACDNHYVDAAFPAADVGRADYTGYLFDCTGGCEEFG